MKFRYLFLLLLVVPGGCSARIRQYRPEVVNEYPHDAEAYTQGLFFHDGNLYESTGLNGKSSFRKVNLTTGVPSRRLDFARKYFVEGSVVLDSTLYVLTWQNKVAFTYDPRTLEYRKTYSYPREGWGLTTDGEYLIASDGTSNLYFMDGEYRLKKTVQVTKDSRPVRLLNELEYIDGKIWANVYMTDVIVIIDPSSGKVEGYVDCRGLLPSSLRDDSTDVLNGIACNPEDGRIYLTGKNWKRLYEIRLKPVD